MGELHLEVLLARLAEAGIAVRAGVPRVALRETVVGGVSGVTHRLVRQGGGPGMYAILTGDLMPTGSVAVGEIEVEDRTSGGSLPARYAAAAGSGSGR